MDEEIWAFIILIIILIGLILLGGYAIHSASCSSQANAMGIPSSYGPLQGCMIKPAHHNWVPIKNYRVI